MRRMGIAAVAVLVGTGGFGAGAIIWKVGLPVDAHSPRAAATPSADGGMPGMTCCGMMDGGAPPAGAASMPGVMGGMMGGGMMHRTVQETPRDQAGALGSAVPAGATVDANQNEIRFGTSTVRLTVLASPDDGPAMTFRIAGLTNPRAVVPAGATVTVQLINADADTSHGWLLSAVPPPFGTMAMMVAPPAFPGSFAMPVPRATQAGMPTETMTFTAGAVGQYTYLCPVMGHAQQGMDGQFVVTG